MYNNAKTETVRSLVQDNKKKILLVFIVERCAVISV